MKKAYSLDYSIERDIDRVRAVKDILDQLPTDPTQTELEQMGSYILYGKDENGKNAVQRGETYDGNSRRFNSFKKTEDKVLSLDEVLDNPLADQQKLRPAHERYVYVSRKTTIKRPKYNKKTGELIDIGDGDIPGIWTVWDSVDRLEHWIAILEKKIPPDESTMVVEVDSYRLYQLKHQLIDLRRHQYYLKDSYKPTLHFQGCDHPKQQFINWAEDAAYWMPLDQWQRKVNNSLLHSVSKNLDDYETRINSDGETEVRWVVSRHTFNWEDPNHIKALINNYQLMYDFFKEKLDTYGRTLIFDFERYREMANLSPVREFILDKKIQRVPPQEISFLLQEQFGLKYTENYIGHIVLHEIPEKIAAVATRNRMLLETPEEDRKVCYRCGRALPRNTLFYSRNRNRKDGFSSVCKECEKIRRIEKGGSAVDKRSKEAEMLAVQARKAGI